VAAPSLRSVAAAQRCPPEVGSTSISKPVGSVHVQISPYAGDPTNPDVRCRFASQLPDTGALKGPGSANSLNVLHVGPPQEYTVTWADTAVTPDCMNQNDLNDASTSNKRLVVHQADGIVSPTASYTTSPTIGAQAGLHASAASPHITITNGSGSGNYLIDSTGLNPSLGRLCVSDILGGRGAQVDFSFI